LIASIASAAAQMKQENLQAEVGARVNKMALDNAESQGNAVVEMIEMQKEIQTHLGSEVNTWA